MKVRVEVKPPKSNTPPQHIPTPREIVEMRSRNEITPKDGLKMLQRYVRQTFPQERIVKMIEELCQADDIKSAQEGLYKSPNWSTRHKGLQEVLKLLDIDDDITKPKLSPVNIQFNVIKDSPAKIEIKDKGEEGHGETIQLNP